MNASGCCNLNLCTFGCPNPCAQVQVSCDNALSVIIQSILNLAQPNGSDELSIFEETLNLCPTMTDIVFQQAIAKGASRGVLYRRFASADTEPTYMINANMFMFNPKNMPLMRFPCAQDSFFVHRPAQVWSLKFEVWILDIVNFRPELEKQSQLWKMPYVVPGRGTSMYDPEGNYTGYIVSGRTPQCKCLTCPSKACPVGSVGCVPPTTPVCPSGYQKTCITGVNYCTCQESAESSS